MYKAVILDLDDTLYDYASLNDNAIACASDWAEKQLLIDHHRFMDAFTWARKQTKEELGDVAASHNRMLYFQKTLEHLGFAPACSALDLYDCYWGYMIEHMQLSCGALEFLQYCKYHSIKTGICSDLTAHIQHRKIKKLGIAHLIDVIVTSEEAGVEKPDSRMFTMVLDKLAVTPSQALYIGDSYKKDVIGAESVNMDVLWYNGKDDDKRTIHSFAEIVDRMQ